MALQGSHLRGCAARGALELLKSRPFSKLCIQGAQVEMTNTAAYSERTGHDAVTKAREKLHLELGYACDPDGHHQVTLFSSLGNCLEHCVALAQIAAYNYCMHRFP